MSLSNSHFPHPWYMDCKGKTIRALDSLLPKTAGSFILNFSLKVLIIWVILCGFLLYDFTFVGLTSLLKLSTRDTATGYYHTVIEKLTLIPYIISASIYGNSSTNLSPTTGHRSPVNFASFATWGALVP